MSVDDGNLEKRLIKALQEKADGWKEKPGRSRRYLNSIKEKGRVGVEDYTTRALREDPAAPVDRGLTR